MNDNFLVAIFEAYNSEEMTAEKIQPLLARLKPLAPYARDGKIPLEILEKLAGKYVRNYDARVSFIRPAYYEGYPDRIDGEIAAINPYTPLCRFSAPDIYTLYAKICLVFHRFIRTGKIHRRTRINPNLPENPQTDSESEEGGAEWES